MPIRYRLATLIPEEATAIITATVRDLDDVGIPAASLDSLVVTLYDDLSDDIINTRDAQDILNANGGTVNSAGGLTLRLDPADTVIVDDAQDVETHVALLEWQWTEDSIVYYGKQEIAHKVKNLEQVP